VFTISTDFSFYWNFLPGTQLCFSLCLGSSFQIWSSRLLRLGIDSFFFYWLYVLQILAIVLRPKKDAKVRRYWNWYHHWVGRFALVLAAVNLFVGIHLAKENGWNVGYGIILGLEIASIVALETIFCIRGRNKEHSSPTMSPNFAPNYDNDVWLMMDFINCEIASQNSNWWSNHKLSICHRG